MSTRGFKTYLVGIALVFLMTSYAQDHAKDQFVGLGAQGFVAGGFFVPVPTLHYGAEVLPHLRLCGSLSSLLYVNLVRGDALYIVTVPDASGYIGGGPDMLFVPYSAPIFVLHATAGGEYRTGDVVGLFTEIQPFVAFDDGYIVGAGSVL